MTEEDSLTTLQVNDIFGDRVKKQTFYYLLQNHNGSLFLAYIIDVEQEYIHLQYLQENPSGTRQVQPGKRKIKQHRYSFIPLPEYFKLNLK